MPAAIKAFNVNTSSVSPFNVYTCPAGRVAKVSLGTAVFGVGSTTKSIVIGGNVVLQTYETNSHLHFNATTASGNITSGPPIECYLTSGLSIVVNSGAGGISASLLVIEEVAS